MGANRSIVASGPVRPDDDSASITARHRVCIDPCVFAEIRGARILLGPLPLVVTTDEDGAAACFAGRVDLRAAEEADILTQNLHRAARRAGVRASYRERACVAHDAGRAAVDNDFAVARDE